MHYQIGVDEAGRGPLAGPVSVGLVAVAEGFDVAKEFPGVADSKKLSEKKREEIFELLVAKAGGVEDGTDKTGSLRSPDHAAPVRFFVAFESAEAIDQEGIAVVIRRAITLGVHFLTEPFRSQTSENPKSDFGNVEVLLDGSLVAPPEYRQKTIIGGDASVPLISLASIAAKVCRDRLMYNLAVQYPEYGFEKHKGYGTKAHYEALRTHGLCEIHRASFVHFDKGLKVE